ncbi:hypothetical protein IAI10_16840 [Clostridium sp. 19966]|uniref:hypothetical protein n=1 Tax=Clostridium sp. 19966 TaxID=2768166 RepID=UPI0028DE4A86|nr:hypothetical protein [Clostridium sp. 19966]MDT8718335.1 hypothetical protein [Clostridium sp. 19966]
MKALKFIFSLSVSLCLTLGLFIVQFSFFTHMKLLKPELYTNRLESLTLYSAIDASIKSDLAAIAKSCNFPKDIFNDIVSYNWVRDQIVASTYQTIDYMSFKKASVPKVDTSYVSEKLISNINNYLISSNIPVNETAKKDLDELNREIQTSIKNNINAFSVNKLSNSGYFQNFRLHAYWLYAYKTSIIIANLFLILILLIINIRSFSLFASWCGYCFIAAGLLALLPSLVFIISKSTDRIFFSSNILKLLAVPTILDYINFFVYTGIGFISIGALLILLYGLLEARKRNVK